MRFLGLALCLPLWSWGAFAQQSLFQTSDGESSLYLQQSTAAINLGDSKASLGYTHRTNVKSSPIWGYEVFATANKGVSSLFTSDKAKAPEGGGDFTFGKHFLATSNDLQPTDPDLVELARTHPGQIFEVKNAAKAREDWMLLDVDIATRLSSCHLRQRQQLQRRHRSTNFEPLRHTTTSMQADLSSVLLGVPSAGTTLPISRPHSSRRSLPSAPVGSNSSIVKTQTGFYGAYKDYTAAPIYFDGLYYIPKVKTPGFGNRLAVDLIARADVAITKRSAFGGLGLFFFKKGNTTSPIGGVTGTYDGSKFQFSLVTGFVISK